MMPMSLRSLVRGPLLWRLVGISWLLVLILGFILIFFPYFVFVGAWLVYFALALTVLVPIVHIIEYLSRPATGKTQVRKIVQDRRWWIVIFVLWMLALFGVFPWEEYGTNILVAFPVTILVLAAKIYEYLTRPAQTPKKSIR